MGHEGQSVTIADTITGAKVSQDTRTLGNSTIQCPMLGHVNNLDDSANLTECCPMAKPLFTSANAREMAAKAHESRRQRTLAAQLANATEPQPTQTATPVADDPLANKFTCALTKTLDKFLACDDARELASIARSMREVRETYHLWSGQPKPGTIKPERQSSRQSVKQPSEPKLDPSTPQ